MLTLLMGLHQLVDDSTCHSYSLLRFHCEEKIEGPKLPSLYQG